MTMNQPKLRVLQLAASVPFDEIPHAGGRYQLALDRLLVNEGASMVLLAQHGPAMLRGVRLAPSAIRVLDPEVGMRSGRWRDAIIRGSRYLNRVLRHSPLSDLHAPFVLSLVVRPYARRLVRTADVIDLQWFDMVQLLPLMRFLGRRGVRIIGTFHDVDSQRLEREAAAEQNKRAAKRLRRRCAQLRRMEKDLASHLDVAVVLSEKDAKLLRCGGVPSRRIHVISPHMRAADHPLTTLVTAHTPAAPVVLMVGWMFRQENIDAAHWMLQTIWPKVLRAIPEAQLHIIGADAPEWLRAETTEAAHVTMHGYVDDLDAMYRLADCAIVPLRGGAGVKFKTIEAILAGVPTVSTRIGAEGVGTGNEFVTVTDDASMLAAGVVRALTDPSAKRNALSAAQRLRSLHTREAFCLAVRSVYNLGTPKT